MWGERFGVPWRNFLCFWDAFAGFTLDSKIQILIELSTFGNELGGHGYSPGEEQLGCAIIFNPSIQVCNTKTPIFERSKLCKIDVCHTSRLPSSSSTWVEGAGVWPSQKDKDLRANSEISCCRLLLFYCLLMLLRAVFQFIHPSWPRLSQDLQLRLLLVNHSLIF